MTMSTETPPTAPAEAPPTLLLVDDEPNVLNALQRALYPDGYRLLTARSGPEALNLLERETVAVIVSDQRMARLSGVELLEAASRLQPETVRIMLTGYAEPQAIIDAINRGHVYRFIAKPWDDADLRLTLRRAVEARQLGLENRRLLAAVQAQNAELERWGRTLETRVAERTAEAEAQRAAAQGAHAALETNFADTIRVFTALLELRDSSEAAHGRRVAAVACALAENHDLTPAEVRDIEIAAWLHDLGKFSIPDAVLAKPETALTPEEAAMARRHPVIGHALLAGIERLATVASYIYHHHERWDGLGYPDKLAADAIPLGARIIAVANAFDHAVYNRAETLRRTPVKALEDLARRAESHFDPQVVLALARYVSVLRQRRPERGEIKIALSLLRPGLVLARDLSTVRERLLVARDIPLTQSHVERIANFAQIEELQPIYIYRDQDLAE